MGANGESNFFGKRDSIFWDRKNGGLEGPQLTKKYRCYFGPQSSDGEQYETDMFPKL